MQLSDHFTLAEMVFSQTATRENIDNRPSAAQVENLRRLCTRVLEPLRVDVDAPLVVTSGFRSPALNRAVSGSPTSEHLLGLAADIVCFAMPTKQLFKRVITLGLPFRQLILEGGRKSVWVHVSFNAGGERSEIMTATFPPAGGVVFERLTRAQALAL